MVHLENQLKVNESIGFIDGIATAKRNIAITKSIYEDDNSEELLEASRELYELRIAQLGEESEYTIRAGKNYAIDLQNSNQHEQTICAGKKYAIDLHNANRRDEAKELLVKLLATSKQVLGPNHSTTMEVELALN